MFVILDTKKALYLFNFDLLILQGPFIFCSNSKTEHKRLGTSGFDPSTKILTSIIQCQSGVGGRGSKSGNSTNTFLISFNPFSQKIINSVKVSDEYTTLTGISYKYDVKNIPPLKAVPPDFNQRK